MRSAHLTVNGVEFEIRGIVFQTSPDLPATIGKATEDCRPPEPGDERVDLLEVRMVVDPEEDIDALGDLTVADLLREAEAKVLEEGV